jgi:small subunit ribosomal protein S1
VSEPEEDDFAALFEASTQKARRIEKGQTIQGTIVAIGEETALVDVGGKSEAVIDIDELKDDDGRVEVAVGDRIQAAVLSTAGGLKLSRRLALRAATAQQLEDAFRSGLPVEGKVERAVKGGYEIRIARQRAFCPGSQIDLRRAGPAEAGHYGGSTGPAEAGPYGGSTGPAEAGHYEGRVFPFRIIEYKDARNIVVSRRVLLEEQQRAAEADVRKSIVEGAVLTGRVASVRDFGAFVDLGGGVQGLLHVSEMAWARVSDTSAIVKPGDEITVKVLRVDAEGQKISLGLKQLTGDPWSTVRDIVKAGQLRAGRVSRVAEFGVFVELEPGIEGLIPLSETGIARDADTRKAFPPGTSLQVVVDEVDAPARRIRLSVTAVEKMREADEVREYNERDDAAPAKGFGSMADKLRDAMKPRER